MFKGSIVAIVTPFHNGKVDEAKLRELIDFQIEKQIEGKNFGDEIMRIYSKGRILPQQWMLEAVGEKLSNEPLLEAVDKALGDLK